MTLFKLRNPDDSSCINPKKKKINSQLRRLINKYIKRNGEEP